MNRYLMRMLALMLIWMVVGFNSAHARITRVVETGRESPTFDGLSFGEVGSYEYIYAKAYGELDPDDPKNNGIVNLDRAPRNAAERVEYSVDLTILKPVNVAQGNGFILYDVLNRGSKRLLTGRVNGGGSFGEARTAADTGTGYLMREGYSMVWSGWQGDLQSKKNQSFGGSTVDIMAGQFPVAHGVTSPIREEFIFEDDSSVKEFDLVYAAASVDSDNASLTVRSRQRDPHSIPDDLRFEWISDRKIRIHRPQGFDAGSLYELIYVARDPIVMGVGFAATRDVIDFLRYSSEDDYGYPNPLFVDGDPGVEHVMGLGISQSGRFLRDFVYLGFNDSEENRTVFDGILPIVAGSRRTMVNLPFSKPGDFSREHETHLARGDQFPFTYATVHDPISDVTDGIMSSAKGDVPKVFHIDTDTEIFQARASLVSTDPSGNHIRQPRNVRLYFIAGSQHAPPATPSWGRNQRPTNPLGYGDLVRALIHAMREWIVDGRVPPDSRFPNVSDGSLVSPNDPIAQYPFIPDFRYHGLVNGLRLRDDNEIIGNDEGPAYPVLVVAKDSDGNNIAGIRHPLLEVPLGTHAGWNLRRRGFAENALHQLDGSYIPFALNRAERERSGDQRRSLEERYASVEEWETQLSRSAERLVRDRFLLREDADRLLEQAKEKGFNFFGKIPQQN